MIDRPVRKAGPVEVHVIPPYRPFKYPLTARLPRLARPVRRSQGPLTVRRTVIDWALSVLAPLAVTALLPARGGLGLAGALLCTLLTVVLAALVGGLGPAAMATATGFLAADFRYTRLCYSLRVDRPYPPSCRPGGYMCRVGRGDPKDGPCLKAEAEARNRAVPRPEGAGRGTAGATAVRV
ncbi:DUF4118 domain-containing protein [Streptomyces sp. NPDC014744]|uniref:DUF4118 domain-containing protein n=1 Tax=Streptomyces sp. NPDC014744 TaxID=3364903 RepID=UPI0036FD17EE